MSFYWVALCVVSIKSTEDVWESHLKSENTNHRFICLVGRKMFPESQFLQLQLSYFCKTPEKALGQPWSHWLFHLDWVPLGGLAQGCLGAPQELGNISVGKALQAHLVWPSPYCHCHPLNHVPKHKVQPFLVYQYYLNADLLLQKVTFLLNDWVTSASHFRRELLCKLHVNWYVCSSSLLRGSWSACDCIGIPDIILIASSFFFPF